MTYSAPQTCCRTFLTPPCVKNHNSTVRQERSSAIEKARIELLTSGKLSVWRIKMFLWLLHNGCLKPETVAAGEKLWRSCTLCFSQNADVKCYGVEIMAMIGFSNMPHGKEKTKKRKSPIVTKIRWILGDPSVWGHSSSFLQCRTSGWSYHSRLLPVRLAVLWQTSPVGSFGIWSL